MLADFTHLETVNLVFKSSFGAIRHALREELIRFIKTEMVFRGPFQG